MARPFKINIWKFTEDEHTVLPRIIAPEIINFRGILQENILSIFQNIYILGNHIVLVECTISIYSVIPSEWGRKLYTTLGGRLFEGGNYSGNTVLQILYLPSSDTMRHNYATFHEFTTFDIFIHNFKIKMDA